MSTEYIITGDIEFDYDAEIGYGDLIVENRDLKRDQGLRTAIIISLYSNRRAADEDELPDDNGTKEGWWADKLRLSDDNIGSKLWLIGRGKIKADEIIPKAEQFTCECLQWMIDDNVAESIDVEASIIEPTSIEIDIEIIRPEIEKKEFYRFFYNWQAEYNRSL